MTDSNCLPPNLGLDYRQTPVRAVGPRGLMPQARAHETVLVSPVREPDVGDLVTRAKAEKDGGNWLAEKLGELSQRRLDAAVARRNGYSVRDHESEALSCAAIRNMRDFQNSLDFDVTVTKRDAKGNERAVTTSAFALAMSNLATTDLMVAMESVPTVVDQLVMEIDDNQPNTEVPSLDDFPNLDIPNKQRPKPLTELEPYPEIGASEERYTGLRHRSGFQRAFSQEAIDRGGPYLFSLLTNLGVGAQETIEFFGLRDIIDYDGSASSGSDYVMIRDRAGAALFSSTANTPSTRTPNGTRINNNALADVTDLETLRARLATMRNHRLGPSPVPLRVLLVPDALWLTAWTLLNSQGVPGSFNEVNFYGPSGPGRMMLLSTPMLDLYSSTAWYGGDPKAQFVRKWALRPEVAVHAGNGTLPFVTTREGFRIRIGWDMKVFVRDHVRWVQCLTGSTSPKDS